MLQHQENEENSSQNSQNSAQSYSRYGVPSQVGTPFAATPQTNAQPAPQTNVLPQAQSQQEAAQAQFRSYASQMQTPLSGGTHTQEKTAKDKSVSSSLWVLPFSPFLAIAGFCSVFTASFVLQQILLPSGTLNPPRRTASVFPPSGTGTTSDGDLASVNTLPSTTLSEMTDGQKRYFQLTDFNKLATGTPEDSFFGFEGANLDGAGQDQWGVVKHDGILSVQAFASPISDASGRTRIASYPHGSYQNKVSVDISAFAGNSPASVDFQPNPIPGSDVHEVYNPQGNGNFVRGSSSPIQHIETTSVNSQNVHPGWSETVDP